MADLLAREAEQLGGRRERGLRDRRPHRLRSGGERRELHLERGLDLRTSQRRHMGGTCKLVILLAEMPPQPHAPRARRSTCSHSFPCCPCRCSPRRLERAKRRRSGRPPPSTSERGATYRRARSSSAWHTSCRRIRAHGPTSACAS